MAQSTSDSIQLDLINNISTLFKNMNQKYSETRNLLDLMAVFITKKFGNDADFPPEIYNYLNKERDADNPAAAMNMNMNENSHHHHSEEIFLEYHCHLCPGIFNTEQSLRNHHKFSHYHTNSVQIQIPTTATTSQAESQSLPLVSVSGSGSESQHGFPITKIEVLDQDEESQDYEGSTVNFEPLVYDPLQHFHTQAQTVSVQNMNIQTGEESETGTLEQQQTQTNGTNGPSSSSSSSKIAGANPVVKKPRRNPRISAMTQHKFKCPKPNCDRSYPIRSSLTQHIKNVHSGITYSCSFDKCSYTSVFKSNILKHIRRHEKRKSVSLAAGRLPNKKVVNK